MGLVGILALLLLGTAGFFYLNYQGKSIKRLARAVPVQPESDILPADQGAQLLADNQAPPTSADPEPQNTSPAMFEAEQTQRGTEEFQETEVINNTPTEQTTNPVARVASPDLRTRSTNGMGLPRGENETSEDGNLSTLNPGQNAKEGSIKYHLIAGSFSQHEKATRFVRQLDAQGYPGAQILNPEPGKQNYRVSIFTSMDRAKVANFKSQQEKLGQKTAWIYEEKIP